MSVSPIAPVPDSLVTFKVLFLDHDESHDRMLRAEMGRGKLKHPNSQFISVHSSGGAIASLKRERWDWLVARTDLGGMDSFEVIMKWLKDPRRVGAVPPRICVTTWLERSATIYCKEIAGLFGPEVMVLRVPFTYKIPRILGWMREDKET